MDDHKKTLTDDGQLEQDKEPVKVIMADDDEDDQHVFKEALNEAEIPAEVKTVDNGKELMKELKDESTPNPDIIFLDINMPGKNGKECLKEIKSDENLKDIPTVMYTTSTNASDIEETKKAGADLYVAKPSSFTVLVYMLKKIFTLKWTGDLFKPVRETFFMSEKTIRNK